MPSLPVELEARLRSDQLVAFLSEVQARLTLEAQAKRRRRTSAALAFQLHSGHPQRDTLVPMDEHHLLASRHLPGQHGPIKDFNARTRELLDF